MIPHRLACRLISADYAGADLCEGWRRGSALTLDGCQATLWHQSGVIGCVVTGSNDGIDWWHNFRFMPGYTSMESITGDSGRLYHGGALEYARIIYAWLLEKPISWLLGHSLGGGVAQIVGSSLSIPSYVIAGLPVLMPFQSQPPGARFVTGMILPMDPVPMLRLFFRYVGAMTMGVPTTPCCRTFTGRHGVAHYEAVT